MTENMVTIKGTNGEFTLTTQQLEDAYRYQEMFYTIKDAKRHVSENLKWYNFLIAVIDKTPIKATEEDYENIAADFLERYDCDIDSNRMWEMVIENYFELED